MEGEFTIRANNILIATKTNPNFADVPHPWADVDAGFTSYKLLCKERYLMSPKDYEDRNELRGQLDTYFRDNGLAIVARYPKDRTMQLNSNYEPVKTPDRTGTPAVPSGIKASTGDNLGEIKIYWKAVRNAQGYNIRYRVKGSDFPWQYLPVSKSRGVVIGDLQSGVMYEFWVQALGAKRNSDFGGIGEARAK